MQLQEICLHDIDEALKNKELFFHFQPKISFLTGKIIGAEALVRWEKNGVMIPPAKFIPKAEETGYITLITENLFDLLVADINQHNLANGEIPIAFNISSHDLKTDRFYNKVQRSIGSGRLNPKSIQFELTETSLVDLSYGSIKMMHDFHNLGISLALDDFGTGYSSLEVLSSFPFSLIKLDRSIIKDIATNLKAMKIINASIRMAQHLGLRTVAEGIEDDATYDKLLYNGCNQGQGFFMAKPMPIASFVSLCHSNKRWKGQPIGLIYQAQFDHIQWRKDVMELFYYIKNSSDACLDHDPNYKEVILCHESCNLGKWYYGDGREYGHFTDYGLIEEPHERLHDLGKTLIECIRNDKNDARLDEMFSEINNLSNILIKHLQNLEYHVHKEHFR